MEYYINGKFVDSKDCKIHVSDLGLLRGYGIFDFFRCIGTQPMFLDDHLDRFFNSAVKMDIEVGLERDQLKQVIDTMLQKNNMNSSGIRLLLTGGNSDNGYSKQGSTLILTNEDLPTFTDTPDEYGVKLSLYEYQRMLPEIKTTNYVIGVMKSKLCQQKGVNDLLFHLDGCISELPRSNFFIVDKNEILATPDKGILEGITRKQILKYASSFMEVQERPVFIEELGTAKEAFFSGTGKRIIPVGAVDDVSINKGKTGPLAQKLIKYFYSLEDALVAID